MTFAVLSCGLAALIQTQTITVDAGQVLVERTNGPIGYCANFVGDSDDAAPRERSMADVLAAAGGGTYRWPAGTIAENYLWHPPGEWEDAAQGLRPRPVAPGKFRWKEHLDENGGFTGTMDFDEFVRTCRGAGAEPIVMVSSYGWKLPGATATRDTMIASAREWVRYANVTRKHGIKYWEIGNEVDLKKCPLSLEEYLDYFEDVSAAMKSVDPDIRLGLGLLRGSAKEYFEGAFGRLGNRIDFCVVHQYHSHHTDFAHYSGHDGTYIKSIEAGLRNIDRFAPPETAPDMEVLVTEFSAFSPQRVWTSQQPDITKALLTFEMMGNALTLDRRVRSLNFWITHNPWTDEITCANALLADNTPTAMGAAIELMGSSLLPQMVAAPRVSGDVRTYATRDPEGRALNVLLLYKGAEAREVDLEVLGFRPSSPSGQVRVFEGAEGPDSVEYRLRAGPAVTPKGQTYTLELPPASITVLSLRDG